MGYEQQGISLTLSEGEKRIVDVALIERPIIILEEIDEAGSEGLAFSFPQENPLPPATTRALKHEQHGW